MAGGNLTPRQKMINMMYLVLTALLALNVSKDILNAFIIVNDSLEKTGMIIDKKNQIAINQFRAANEKNTAKVGKFYKQAIYPYIGVIKNE